MFVFGFVCSLELVNRSSGVQSQWHNPSLLVLVGMCLSSWVGGFMVASGACLPFGTRRVKEVVPFGHQ